MAEYFFDLSLDDQREALEYAREQSGRPAHLLEKDIWVVWTLHALFASRLAADLTFKGVPVRLAAGHEPGQDLLGKTTAAHVYCAQGRIRGERYARHWHDLAAIARSNHFAQVLSDRAVATMVADHKTLFFIEKDADGAVIDYAASTQSHLRIVPEGQARQSLADGYAAMLADAVMVGDALPFDRLLEACGELEARLNATAL
ncbi:nucleotidyl transferase AbiEii/AbiGii toxin family protein [Ralstonia solanacearum]|uniref:nucleotidyl transferase AbiEii/AbiGii toxin family protein n=1 Tax=Ralstonia solanacearum TaxID=305 RepID=UPI001E5F7610|nr:nucleotidyl transferase AbiEii/AbiGii toxin family protein [Ralstonia solanacearum]